MKVKTKLILAAVVAVLIGGVVLAFTGFEHYSDGERSGIVQKFSKKGIAFKTWEGELMMANGQVVGTAWPFSVEDNAVADSINNHLSERVKVTYHQVYSWKNWGHLRGETDYFVVAVESAR